MEIFWRKSECKSGWYTLIWPIQDVHKRSNICWKYKFWSTNSSIHRSAGTGLQEPYNLDGNSSCLDVFAKFFGDEFMEIITDQSNLYKGQKIHELRKSKKLKPYSRILRCDDVIVNEIYVFHALVILMGIIKKPSIEMYWSGVNVIETPIFTTCMTLVRFQSILSTLHFSIQEDSFNKITKIRPVIDYLLERIQGIYRPGRNICIDESLMKFHGRLSFKQFNRNKRARFRVKFYETCDSTNRYIYSFKFYVGQDRVNAKSNLLGISGQVFIDMLADVAAKGAICSLIIGTVLLLYLKNYTTIKLTCVEWCDLTVSSFQK